MSESLRGFDIADPGCSVCDPLPRTSTLQSNNPKLMALRRPFELDQLEEFNDEVFASFLEVAPDAVVVADRNGRILCVNAQTERMFQYSRAELLGRQIEVLIPERFRERHIQQRASYDANPVMRPMGVGQSQLYGQRKDQQEFPVEISLGTLPTATGFFIASVIRDVTKQKILEAELKERTRELEEANRNKDEFLGKLAHELRHPLAAIVMTVESLRHSPLVDGPKHLWDIISRQASQMMHLVNDLQDVSRIAQGKVRIQKVPVLLNTLISQAIEAVQSDLNEHKQQLTISMPQQAVRLSADPVRLVEVFTNLLNNAIKYTDPGGQIFLKASEENDQVVVEVRDTGIGISPEMLPLIFEPYTQVATAIDRSEGGIGIGLTMVAQLIALHGGKIEVFSKGLGHGSRFVVRLPAEISHIACIEMLQ